MITIKYFASLREQIGKTEEQVAVDGTTTARELWQSANPQNALPDNTLVAINQTHAAIDATIQSGDEVAFFPPVTGG